MSQPHSHSIRTLFGKHWDTKWSPRARSVLSMAMASAIHFAGNEFARAGTLTLLTSEKAGFSHSSVVPFALGCVSPFSLGLLWIYASILDRSGPSVALRNCAIIYAVILAVGGLLLLLLDPLLEASPQQQTEEDSTALYRYLSRALLFFLFLVENSFIQLLFTQQWAFMSSVQSREEAVVWFAPIAGMGSIASTASAFAVSPLVDRVGLAALLFVAAVFMLISAYCGMDAYHIAKQHGFTPVPKDNDKGRNNNSHCGQNLLQRAVALFKRVPILGALCVEVLFSQFQSSVLNSLFVLKLKEALPNDHERARYTGNCYAGINASSGMLQFAVLPVLAKRLSTKQLWILMPTAMVMCSTMMFLQKSENIHMVSGSFLLMKAMEYSVRGIGTEMVYVSLDYESRFLGKEIIGVFVNRFGKSAVSLLTAYWGTQLSLFKLSVALVVVSAAWLAVSLRLTKLLDEPSTTSEATDDKEKSE